MSPDDYAMTVEEIAAVLAMSHQNVQQTERRAIRFLWQSQVRPLSAAQASKRRQLREGVG